MNKCLIRWVSVLLLAALSGCLTGSGTNQTSSNFVISSNSATNISDTTATLVGGFMNTAGANASVTFELGPTTAYGTSATPTVFSSAGYASVKQDFTGLSANTTYHYRLKIVGATATTYSADNTFTTLSSLMTPTPVVSGAPWVSAPEQMAMDANNIYWTEFPSVDAKGVTTLGSVKVMQIAGGAVTSIASGLTNPFGIAVDSVNGDVYFADYGSGALYRRTKGGTGFTLSAITVNAAPVAPATTPLAGSLLTATATAGAVAGTGVGTGYTVGEILNVVLAPGVGGQVQVKTVDAAGGVLTIAVWSAGSGYTPPLAPVAPAVNAIPTSSTGYVAKIQQLLNNPEYVAVDANNVYYTEKGSWNASALKNNSDGTILRLPKAVINGGTGLTLTLAAVTPAPLAPAVTPLAGGLSAPLTITTAGSGYKVGDVVNVSDTAVACTAPVAPALPICGSGGKVTVATIGAGGVVTGVTVSSPGSGYTAASVANTSYTGIGFTTKPTVVLGDLATAPITTPGTGYTVGEVLNFVVVTAGKAAAGATGELRVKTVDANGGVTAVDIINAGAGANLVAPAAALPTNFIGYAVATGLAGPQNIVTDGVNVYWNETANSVAGAATVKSAPINGNGSSIPTQLATGLTGPQFIALDPYGVHVYYTSGNGTLSRVPVTGGTPQVVVSNIYGVQPFAVDATSIYWGEALSGLLKKAPAVGGTNTVLASGLVNPGAVALTSNNVYWLQQSAFDPALNGLNQTGKIMSHAK